MRVLAFSSLFPNAADPAHGIFVYNRVASLAALPGNQVEAIAPVPFVPRWVKSPCRRRFAGVPNTECIGSLRVHHPRYPLLPKVSMPAHGFLMLLGARELARRLQQQHSFDCIAAQYVYPDGFAAVHLGKLLRIPVVVWALGTDINVFPSFKSILPLIRWTLKNARGIVAVSSELRNRMIQLGAPAAKIKVIGNGVDTEVFRTRSRQEARRILGLPQRGPILVSVASLREPKGHQHVIAALAKILPTHPEATLYLVGEGEFLPKLEQLVRKLSLQDRVCFAGSRRCEEIPLWFNAADLSILASSREGWPNVILESLACGTPVVGTPVGQVPEILKSQELGLIARQDSDSLASAIAEVLERKWNRQAMMNFAHSRPWKTVARDTQLYLESIVGSLASPATGRALN
jgi:teichuronic acid biosynthesis glycosyltransferase TuaC